MQKAVFFITRLILKESDYIFVLEGFLPWTVGRLKVYINILWLKGDRFCKLFAPGFVLLCNTTDRNI